MQTSLRSISHNQQSLKCESTLRKSFLLSWLRLSLLSLLERVTLHVNRDVLAGQVACREYFTNRRYLTGLGFGTVGVLQIFVYLLFPEAARNSSWYYQNWFYFLESTRLWFVICFFSTAIYFHCPSKNMAVWVVYGIVLMIGAGGVIHYSFFTTSYETYHSLSWLEILLAPTVGFSFALAVKYLCYRKYHLKDGNYARIIGMIEMDVPWGEKEKSLKLLAKEFREYNSRI